MKRKKEVSQEDTEFNNARDQLKDRISAIRAFYEHGDWGSVRKKQAMMKEIFTTYRDIQYDAGAGKDVYEFYFVMEQKEGFEFTCAWYKPGKYPGTYTVKENAWGLKLIEGEDKKMHFSRIGRCPLILPETTPGHDALLLWMFDRGSTTPVYINSVKVVNKAPQYCIFVLRINRPTLYQRIPKPYPPKGYTEFLPFVLKLKIHPGKTV